MEYVKSHGNFGDLPDNYSSYGKSKTAILPFPYEKTTSYGKGTERALLHNRSFRMRWSYMMMKLARSMNAEYARLKT